MTEKWLSFDEAYEWNATTAAPKQHEWRITCPMCNEGFADRQSVVETYAHGLLKGDFHFKHRFPICTGKWEIQRREVGEWEKL
jgi:hypothetical protein